MTTTHDDHSLSRLELVVLARMSAAKPPSARDVNDVILKLVLPEESPAHAKQIAKETVATLCRRALATEQRRLTDNGRNLLRTAFDLAHTPSWREVRDAHLPALSVGLLPGTEDASKATRSADTMSAAILTAQLGVAKADTLTAAIDALIARDLGIPPGPLTLARIRMYVLARHAGIEPKDKATTPDVELAAKRFAVSAVRARRADKPSLAQALGRRWLHAAGDPRGHAGRIVPALPIPPTPTIQPASPMPPAGAIPALPSQPALPFDAAPPAPTAPPRIVPEPPRISPQPEPTSADALLTAVREAIREIGPDGRFGPDKVYVSAIWHHIEHDRRLIDLSLDRFKRWLVVANRDRLLDLARADLVGAMEASLVSESEIEDLGSTFHFVLDHSAVRPGSDRSGSERRAHAR
jgi:hypothetical protein